MNIRQKHQRCGFTLIELLAVITIIAILASISIGALNMVRGRALEKKAETHLALFQNGLENFKRDIGQYPHQGNVLEAFTPASFPRSNQTTISSDRSSRGIVLGLGGGDGSNDQEDNKVYIADLVSYENNAQKWFIDDAREYIADPWGNPWAYRAGYVLSANDVYTPDETGMINPAGNYDLWSAGEDGLDDTPDDKVNF